MMLGSSIGSAMPTPKGRGIAYPNFWVFCMPTFNIRNNIHILITKFCTVVKLDVKKIFTLSTTNADARSVCGS